MVWDEIESCNIINFHKGCFKENRREMIGWWIELQPELSLRERHSGIDFFVQNLNGFINSKDNFENFIKGQKIILQRFERIRACFNKRWNSGVFFKI